MCYLKHDFMKTYAEMAVQHVFLELSSRRNISAALPQGRKPSLPHKREIESSRAGLYQVAEGKGISSPAGS
jgi:hypothetical protein